jgi:hypothetical protein
MMIRIGTRWKYYDGQTFLKELFCGAADSPSNPFEEVQVPAGKQEVQEDITQELEQVIKELCRIRKWAEVIAIDERYTVQVHMDEELSHSGIETFMAPLRRPNLIPIAKEMVFPEMEVLQLTDFYQVKVKQDSAEINRIIMIPTKGLPDERESAVVNSVIKDKRSFVEYIAFILGDDYLLTLLEESILGKSGFYGDQKDRLPALYEKMLKTGAHFCVDKAGITAYLAHVLRLGVVFGITECDERSAALFVQLLIDRAYGVYISALDSGLEEEESGLRELRIDLLYFLGLICELTVSFLGCGDCFKSALFYFRFCLYVVFA